MKVKLDIDAMYGGDAVLDNRTIVVPSNNSKSTRRRKKLPVVEEKTDNVDVDDDDAKELLLKLKELAASSDKPSLKGIVWYLFFLKKLC